MNWISPMFGEDNSSFPPPRKRTKKKSVTPEKPKSKCINTSECNWLLKHKPKSVDELAVHVKKVKELETWLEQSAVENPKNKILLLTGPSGCAKTTALQVLCKCLNVKVFEWITPVDKVGDDSEYPSRVEFSKSTAKIFEEYLIRSSRYGSCLNSRPSRKLVLVKDFPNVFLHSPTTFHDILVNFANKCVNPVVFICSEESVCKKLFTLTIKATCQIHTITFNPIPEQRLLKVLRSILSQESKSNKTLKTLSDGELRIISAASEGDLRSAISKMYFCTIKSDYPVDELSARKKSKPADESTQTSKDSKLDFFHLVGRVLYPKRVESDKGLRFVHSTQTIVESVLSEPRSFVSQLHENYPAKLGNVYDLSDAARKMSTSDVLSTRWQEKDVFQEYALSVTIQGLMVCNRNPEKGRFEAFRRSQTCRLEVDGKAIDLEGKALFSDLCILNYESLMDILPYSRLVIPSLSIAQLDFVQRTCSFK